MEPGHLLHSALTWPPGANARHLKSRHPLVLATQQLISSSEDIRAVHWADHGWKAKTVGQLSFIPGTSTHPPGWPSQEQRASGLTASRTGVGRFCSCLHKWGMASSSACECRAEEQTVDHVVLQCPTHWTPHGLHAARPDGSGRWDNWMTAQYLPRDFVRPSCGFKNWFKLGRRLIATRVLLSSANCTTVWLLTIQRPDGLPAKTHVLLTLFQFCHAKNWKVYFTVHCLTCSYHTMDI